MRESETSYDKKKLSALSGGACKEPGAFWNAR